MAKHSWVFSLGPMDGEAGSFGVAGCSGAIVVRVVVVEEGLVVLVDSAGGDDEAGMADVEGGGDSRVD